MGIVGFAILTIRDLPTPGLGEWIEQVAGTPWSRRCSARPAMALGALVRNQAVAIVGVLVIIFVVDSAVTSLLPDVGRFSPFSALPAAASGPRPDDAGLNGDIDLLPGGLAVLAMLAWIGTLFAIGATLLKRRDVE